MEYKIYDNTSDKKEFYFFMGDIFSYRKYRNELPYLYNSPDCVWLLFFDDKGHFIGFNSYEKHKNNCTLKSAYIFEEYREHGYYEQLFNERFKIIEEREGKQVLKATITNDLLTMYKKHGFKETGTRGSYHTVERGINE